MRRQCEESNNGGFFNDLDANDIINGVRNKQSGEYGEDGNGDNGQNGTDNGKGKKKGGKYKNTTLVEINHLLFFRFSIYHKGPGSLKEECIYSGGVLSTFE